AGVLTRLEPYFEAGHRLWSDAVSRKMYVTGGVGATGNEGFGRPYALPNISAYSETCAVLMFMTLNQRLFMATGDGRYIDVMERGMYNNAIDGVSISGDRFFYVNRLASAGDGRDARWARASLECCPPNLARFLASMPERIYAQDTRTGSIYVNLYASSAATFPVRGEELTLTVRSGMPWSGESRIAIAAKRLTTAVIKLRIPGWASNRPSPGGLYRYLDPIGEKPSITVNGRAVDAAADALGYVSIDRAWSNGDLVEVRLPVESRRIVADEKVVEDRRRMAIERGPIVYCVEWPDTPDGKALDLLVDRHAPLTPKRSAGSTGPLGDVVVVETRATRTAKPDAPAAATLIPYALWANRGVGEMSVWMSTSGYAVGDVGPAGGIIFYENPDAARDGWRYLEAAPFDQSSGAKWGCFRRIIDGARGTAIGAGRQNTADMIAACAEPETAARLCADFTFNGIGGWFLPSHEELLLMYRNLKAAGLGAFLDGGMPDNVSYWTSSQDTADMSTHIDFADAGRVHSDDKDFPRRVRAVRTI
ncbi:MAG TPA: beta-L-arabinofuranosidase domain-containing protein, partial [Vicinamibacterales bacterium]